MGQFRPTAHGNESLLPRGYLLFAIGFVASAGLSVWFIDYASQAAIAIAGTTTRAWIACVSAVVLATSDLQRTSKGDYCSIGLRRQTPRKWGLGSPLGVLAWGVDTGLPMTTIRSTSLPLCGVVFVGLGFGAGWLGLVYGLAFVVGLFLLTSVYRPRSSGANGQDTVTLIHSLLGYRRRVRLVGSAAMVIGSLGLVLLV